MTSSALLSEHCLRLGTSTLYEASGLSCSLDPVLRPMWPGAAVCGPAYPVACAPGDNLALHHAVELAPRGSVLVVDAGGVLVGYWGEILSWAALVQGIRGLVITGGVRDIDALEQMAFPVFACGVSMRGTGKSSAPSVGSPIELGGTPVRPGDLVVADRDGVLCLPAEAVTGVLDRSVAREEKEQQVIEQLKNGARTLDLYGWRGVAALDREVSQ
jgi:4-hydroxy-4-methyl-2-oxoglutarate aldolase